MGRKHYSSKKKDGSHTLVESIVKITFSRAKRAHESQGGGNGQLNQLVFEPTQH